MMQWIASWRRWQTPRLAPDQPAPRPDQVSALRPRPMQLILKGSRWLVWRDDEGTIVYLRD